MPRVWDWFRHFREAMNNSVMHYLSNTAMQQGAATFSKLGVSALHANLHSFKPLAQLQRQLTARGVLPSCYRQLYSQKLGCPISTSQTPTSLLETAKIWGVLIDRRGCCACVGSRRQLFTMVRRTIVFVRGMKQSHLSRTAWNIMRLYPQTSTWLFPVLIEQTIHS